MIIITSALLSFLIVWGIRKHRTRVTPSSCAVQMMHVIEIMEGLRKRPQGCPRAIYSSIGTYINSVEKTVHMLGIKSMEVLFSHMESAYASIKVQDD